MGRGQESRMVIDQSLISLLAPLAGGGLLGFGCGYLLRKLLKLAFIILGGIALLLGYLEYQKIITVNWMVVENQTSTMMTHAVNKIVSVTQHMNTQIPDRSRRFRFAPGLTL